MGATTIARFGINFEYQDARPKKDHKAAASDGGGAVSIASTCSCLGRIPSAVTT